MQVLEKEGKWQDVVRCCDAVLESDPQCLEAWSKRGEALFRLDRVNDAMACFDRAIHINPHVAVAWHSKGVALYRSRRWDEAAECFTRSQQLGHPGAAEALARCQRHRDLEAGSKGVPKTEVEADQWFARGLASKDAGQLEEACACYDRVLSLQPNRVEAWVNKGVVLRHLGQIEQSMICCDRALKLRPDDANAWSNKGNLLESLGRIDEALRCHDQAVRCAPEDAVAWLNRGVLLAQKLSRHGEAIDCFDKSIRLAPGLAEAWLNKGVALSELQRRQEAADCLARGTALVPGSAQAWYLQGSVLFELARYDESLTCFDRCLQLNPQRADAWHCKGAALCRFPDRDRITEALQCFGESARLGNPNAASCIQWCREQLAQTTVAAEVPAAQTPPDASPKLLPDGSDSRLIFAKAELVTILDQAASHAERKNWQQAGNALSQFAAYKGGRFTIWQMMRDEDRLWNVVRKLVRSGQQRPVLANIRLVCAVCGRALVRFCDVNEGDSVLLKKYFPASHWKCPDASHLREPSDGGSSPPSTRYPDRLGLEFPDDDTNLYRAKAAYQAWHAVLENLGATRESLRAAGHAATDANLGKGVARNYIREEMQNCAASERRILKNMTQQAVALRTRGAASTPVTATTTAQRSRIHFTYRGDDFWEIVENWAPEHQMERLPVKTGPDERVFFGKLWWATVSHLLRAAKQGDQVLLEAWVSSAALKGMEGVLTKVLIGKETNIEPGGMDLGMRKIKKTMRASVNDLLVDLGTPQFYSDAPSRKRRVSEDERQARGAQRKQAQSQAMLDDLQRKYPLGGGQDSRAVPGAGISGWFQGEAALARFSLISGIAGVLSSCCGCVGLPLSLLAVILGTISLGRIRRGAAAGRGMAITGIVCGTVGIVLAAIATYVLVTSQPPVPPAPPR